MIGRRKFMTCTLAAATTMTALASTTVAETFEFQKGHAFLHDTQNDVSSGLPIWPVQPPGGGGPDGSERISRHGVVTNVPFPTLTILRPMRPTGTAILVAGGGGYKRIENGPEAIPAARWLASIGVTAFVLTYRLPLEGWLSGTLAPFQDAERAIRFIRGKADHFGIDPNRLGILGFSAGGHLLGMEAVLADHLNYSPTDALDTVSGRPDFSLLIYPVVTVEAPFQNTSTRRVLIGNHPTAYQSTQWSMQTHVHPGLAPFFLVQAADDPVSNPANTAILQAACEYNGVDVERHLFSAGGHGFGLGKPGTETVKWPRFAENWMRTHNFL